MPTVINGEKLGIQGDLIIENPFPRLILYSTSSRLRFFGLRLLHSDIYTKECMHRFKMVIDPYCDYCGVLENVKHIICDCNRAKIVWDKVKNIATQFE
jgi:hypothetical protein